MLDDDGASVCEAYAAPLNAMAPNRRIWATPCHAVPRLAAARPTARAPKCVFSVAQRDRGYHTRFRIGTRRVCGRRCLRFGSRRDIELGARILYDHCVRWGMMPHTAGKTVAMYFGQPVVNLREFLPDEAFPPSRWGTEKRQ